MAERKRIAAIVTAYFPAAHGSHADLVVSKFARGFPASDGVVEPKVDIVSMYVDQPHWTGMETELAHEYGIELHRSIRGALTMRPQGRPGHWTPEDDERPGDLAVDGVMIVAEHGDYAGNERYRHLYPRRYFFEQVCGVFAMSGRSVPVFNDKHLAYDWRDALWMYERARELEVPFMAGSALPLCSRGPELEHEPWHADPGGAVDRLHPPFPLRAGLVWVPRPRRTSVHGGTQKRRRDRHCGRAVPGGRRRLGGRRAGALVAGACRGRRGPRGAASTASAVRRACGDRRRPYPPQGRRPHGGQLPGPGRLHSRIYRRPSRGDAAAPRAPASVRVRRQG